MLLDNASQESDFAFHLLSKSLGSLIRIVCVAVKFCLINRNC